MQLVLDWSVYCVDLLLLGLVSEGILQNVNSRWHLFHIWTWWWSACPYGDMLREGVKLSLIMFWRVVVFLSGCSALLGELASAPWFALFAWWAGPLVCYVPVPPVSLLLRLSWLCVDWSNIIEICLKPFASFVLELLLLFSCWFACGRLGTWLVLYSCHLRTKVFMFMNPFQWLCCAL